jgi:CRISPR-associated protein Csm1
MANASAEFMERSCGLVQPVIAFGLSTTMETIELAYQAWAGEGRTLGHVPKWPEEGIAIEGDFAGIQRFVLRPVPGAGGAARRLRARSFRVLALTRLVAEAVVGRFHHAGAQLFYSAGGRFLVVTRPDANWADHLSKLQQELDEDLLTAYRGELVFHLAGARFTDGRIPVEPLGSETRARKRRPLAAALRSTDGWATDRFLFSADGAAKCDGCGSTAVLSGETERLCQTCTDDRELGRLLLTTSRTCLQRSANGFITLLGQGWTVASDGHLTIGLIHHQPRASDRLGPATFEELSELATGRRYLAYLKIDADRIGEQFRKLSGAPSHIWGLSRLLDHAFSTAVEDLLQKRFPSLYPVYGGGDDLFLIGPWDEALNFVAAWRSKFGEISRGKLTFSAGLALAKPRQHILSKSEEAEDALNEAKALRDSFHGLGATIPWSEFDDAYACARELAKLHAEENIRSALLHNIVELHNRFLKGDARWHYLLSYQVERNVSGPAKDFLRRSFLAPGAQWKHAGFAARFAMLSTAGEGSD